MCGIWKWILDIQNSENTDTLISDIYKNPDIKNN